MSAFNRLSCLTLTLGICIIAFGLSPALAKDNTALVRSGDEQKLTDLELLGKRIFEDVNLSEPRGVSCASCHNPDKAFSGNNNSQFPGVPAGSRKGHFSDRNAPTITYAALNPPFGFVTEKNEEGKMETKAVGGLMQDGDRDTLMHQAEGPLMNPEEMNNRSHDTVVEKVQDAPYAPLLQKIYGPRAFDNATEAFEHITMALMAFESSERFMPFNSKFDQVLQGKAKFTVAEQRGFDIFKDVKKGNCIACHVGKLDSKNPRDWLFTDYTYDAVGLPRNMDLPLTKDAKYYDLGLCKNDDIKARAPKGFNVPSLCGAFRVPTLRNVALTAPYGHNGVFKTLEDVVNFYAKRDTNPELWYPKTATGEIQKFNDLPVAYHGNINTDEVPYNRKKGDKPAFTDAEAADLVAFLKTLSDTPLNR